MSLKFLLVLIGLVPLVISRPSIKKAKCGYESCAPVKDGLINVHLVAHTHDDVGWLKTVDEYYFGRNNSIQKAGVQYILDSVTDALYRDPTRKFIYVETAYFWKWWTRQNTEIKERFRSFVENGQLEFIGGAWSMNDEAASHYHSIVDQFTWGLRKLNDTFGECGRPKIGWQIDPFGHSREMASIFAQLGYDGLLLGRIDYQDKNQRLTSKTPEMVWRSSSNLGDKSDLFTGVMFNTYGPPSGFCFDVLCDDDPVIDDVESPEYNVDKRLDDLFAYIEDQTKYYTTNNIILTMGGDFTYMDANMWFTNLDKLISYGNKRQENGSKYHLLYSTPSCYIKAVHDSALKNNQTWEVKEDDFFPYASDPHAYWTGYFTSRPTSKRFEREGNNFLQVCKQLSALTSTEIEDLKGLDKLREAMGIMQHHDAITGTEKQHVANDYARILHQGFEECGKIISDSLGRIITTETTKPTLETCLLTNTSSCELTETSEKFVVTVYNPLSRPITKHVRLPVNDTAYKVTGPDGNIVKSELLATPESIFNIPGREGTSTYELLFVAENIPQLGFQSYYVEKIEGDRVVKKEILHGQTQKFKFGVVSSITIDHKTGKVSEVEINGRNIPLSQDFMFYNGYVGNNEIFENRSSGAYIFRPGKQEPAQVTDRVKTDVYVGELVMEIYQIFNEWASQVIRVYTGESYVEFDWLIGPLPMNGTNGTEVVSVFKTQLNTNGTFYTDSNGREILKRVRNKRSTWNLDLAEPVAGNYYPVTSKILIRDEDEDLEVAVLNDRAQGGSSLSDGEIELMVHRNCFHDDAFGVGEALNETAFGKGLVVRGSHYLVIGNITKYTPGDSVAAQERLLAQRKLLRPWIFLSKVNATFEEYKANHVMNFSGLTKALPKNIQILTLEPWTNNSVILRLEHIFEKDEDSLLSQNGTVDLDGLFESFQITQVSETTLGANQWIEENERLHFGTAENNNQRERRYVTIKTPNSLEVTLSPMQIRTFIVNIVPKQ